MWPTSEQAACTLAGGISAWRQITANCGNKLVRCRPAVTATLAKDLLLGSWLMTTTPKWISSTWPDLLGPPLLGAISPYLLSVIAMAIHARHHSLWTHKSFSEGVGHKETTVFVRFKCEVSGRKNIRSVGLHRWSGWEIWGADNTERNMISLKG